MVDKMAKMSKMSKMSSESEEWSNLKGKSLERW